mmetsp:Transcript_28925/g.56558  ORF Transcript_28925/g.56558 Transcript_28925/m.56558 type:complete len:359 (+) Transcript_28925:94-1170(+)
MAGTAQTMWYSGPQGATGFKERLQGAYDRKFYSSGILEDAGEALLLPKRLRLNSYALLMCILVPWGLFTGVSWAVSSSLRYTHSEASWFLVTCGFTIALGFLLKWHLHRSWQRHAKDDGQVVGPNLFLLLGLSSLTACSLGVMVGDNIYTAYMRPYYDLTNLGVAADVNPDIVRSSSYLDAGRIVFTKGTHVQQSLALGFKDERVYCVAPIANGNATAGSPTPLSGNRSGAAKAPVSYDFWAVGVDCCVPVPPASFWCGGAAYDTEAHSATRWMSDDERPLFQLAIQQAEVEYGIKAKHPLLLSWTRDASRDAERLREEGVWRFHLWICGVLAVQAAIVGIVAAHFSGKLTGNVPPPI